MSKAKKLLLLGLMAVVSLTTVAWAVEEQVGDLRLGALPLPLVDYVTAGGSTLISTNTYFDPGFSNIPTRDVTGAPVQVNSLFSGTSQTSGGAAADTADIALKLWGGQSNIVTICRWANWGVACGIVQWEIDLTSLETYLTGNFRSLSALDLRLVTGVSDAVRKYDVYLSYTNPAEGITLTDISLTSGADNKTNFYDPARLAAVGDIVGGTYKVLALGYTGNLNLAENLIALYDSGVREFNLIIAANDYYPGRIIGIMDGSGLFIETAYGAAHTPNPPALDGVDATITSVSWYSPEQDGSGNVNDDPNVVSIDSYDIYWSDVSGDFSVATPDNQPGQIYTPAGGIDELTTYFWRVDTHVTYDDSSTAVIEGAPWQFTTASSYFEPVVASDDVITLVELMPATISATVTNNSDALNAPVFTLLDDDYEFPAGAIASVNPTTTDNSNPTATLTTDTPGIYKVKLEVSDGTTTIEHIIIVDVAADACQAAKAVAGWAANYYDRDGNCVVDLSDFAALARQWLDDTSVYGQQVRP